MKQTHDVKLAESLSPITKKLDIINITINESTNESIKQLGNLVKKPDVEDENTQSPAIENTSISRSLLDILTHMKGNKKFFKLLEKDGEVLWNKIPIKALGENRISIKNQEFDITPKIRAYFSNTKLTSQILDNFEKETIFNILQKVGFYSMRHTKKLQSARLKDASSNLPTEIDKIRNPTLPTIENESNNLEGEGLKNIFPFKIIDICNRLKILLGLQLSGHTDTLT